MSRRGKSVAAALLVTSVSASAAWMLKRRSDNRRPHVGLYFEDGSMVSLPDHSPQAEQLVELGIRAVGTIRGV